MRKIELKDVKKTFGSVNAINGLSLSIQEGDVYALLGHNGAGKTTTLRFLLGLLEPDEEKYLYLVVILIWRVTLFVKCVVFYQKTLGYMSL